MSIISFLADHWDDVALVGGALGTLIFGRTKSANTENAKAMLASALRAEVYKLAADPKSSETARAELTIALKRAAVRLNVPAKVADALAPKLVEDAYLFFVERFLDVQLANIAAGAQATADKIKEITP